MGKEICVKSIHYGYIDRKTSLDKSFKWKGSDYKYLELIPKIWEDGYDLKKPRKVKITIQLMKF